jgi:fatty-acyl-CoA synthase
MVPLSWRLSSRELSEALVHAAPALVAIEDEYLGVANDALARLDAPRPRPCSERPVSRPRFRDAGTEDAAPARAVRDDDPLLVIYTSGSEAAPKGVVLTHANCFWNNLALAVSPS